MGARTVEKDSLMAFWGVGDAFQLRRDVLANRRGVC